MVEAPGEGWAESKTAFTRDYCFNWESEALAKISHSKEFPSPANWALATNKRWKTKVDFLTDADTNQRVIQQCNIGLLELKDGKPVKHTLICADETKVFMLGQ